MAAIAQTVVPSPALISPRRFLGRQPIVDMQRRLVGDRILIAPHGPASDGFGGTQTDEDAAREVLDHCLLLIPEPESRAAFVPCTGALLLQDFVTLLPPANTVLALPPWLSPTPEVAGCCHALRRQGYRFSLDNLRLDDPRLSLLELASFIHFDFDASDYFTRREIYTAAGPVQFVAGSLETDFQMRMAVDEGCTLFHGSFFVEPAPLPSATIPRNSVVYLRLLAALERQLPDLRAVEKLIAGDPALCYRVLRFANSALQAHPGEISTVREALLMVGDDALRRMATLAIAGALAGRRSTAVLEMALARARFCELLAPSISQDPAQLYLLGVISALDSLLEAPMHRVLQSLPIRADMKAALSGDSSPAGFTLQLVRALEACDWRECQSLQTRLHVDEAVISAASVDALRWASASVASLAAPQPS